MIGYNGVYFDAGFGNEHKTQDAWVKAYSGVFGQLTDEDLKEVYKLLYPTKKSDVSDSTISKTKE